MGRNKLKEHRGAVAEGWEEGENRDGENEEQKKVSV